MVNKYVSTSNLENCHVWCCNLLLGGTVLEGGALQVVDFKGLTGKIKARDGVRKSQTTFSDRKVRGQSMTKNESKKGRKVPGAVKKKISHIKGLILS